MTLLTFLKTKNLPAKIFVEQKLRRARKLKTNQGFTIIEMVVVVGIFALLSGVIFSGFNDFSVKASLDNLTHQVALIIREAQVYGISVSQSSPQQFKGYGAYFSVETPGNHKNFFIFNDKNQNETYDSGVGSPCDGSDECIEKVSIKTGDMVEKIRAREKTDILNTLSLKEVHIVFTRPNPDANILGIDLSNNQFDNLADVEIYLISPRGAEKRVVVWSTGQIAVE